MARGNRAQRGRLGPDRTPAVWVSALLIADFLPAVAIGFLLGPLVDRLSRKRLLVGADIVRFAAFVLLAFAVRPWQIVALAFFAGVASGFARPAAYAGLPNLVPAETLPRANSLLRTADQLTITIGTLLGGIVVAASGPDIAYSLNAASFVLSAVLRAAGSRRGCCNRDGPRATATGVTWPRASGRSRLAGADRQYSFRGTSRCSRSGS